MLSLLGSAVARFSEPLGVARMNSLSSQLARRRGHKHPVAAGRQVAHKSDLRLGVQLRRIVQGENTAAGRRVAGTDNLTQAIARVQKDPAAAARNETGKG